MSLQQKLEQGIAAARVNNKKEARALLKEVVKADETQIEAWLWLYKIVDGFEEKEVCLENVLTLEPDNQFAREELAWVKSEQEKYFGSFYLPEPDPLPKVEAPPPAADYLHKDEFDNELLCPYCLALTNRDDRRCPACRHLLIVSRRVQDERTAWLWRGFFLQFWVSVIFIAFGASYATLMGKWNGVSNPIPFLPIYWGQPVDQPQLLTQALLQIFPRWAFWGLIAATLFSLLLMALLYIRIPYGNVIYLISATAMLGLGLTGLFLFFDNWLGIGASLGAIMIGAAQMIITFNLWNDFSFKEGRIILRMDRGVKGVRSLAISGQKYSRVGMWGLAMLHWRAAVLKEPDSSAHHLGLIIAYLKLKRFDLAEKALRYAEQQVGNSTQLDALHRQLKASQSRHKTI